MARKKSNASELELTWEESGKCPVRFIDDAFGTGGGALAETLRLATGAEKPRILLVADGNVVQHSAGLGTRIGKWVQDQGVELAGRPVVISGGEKIKADNLQNAMRLLQVMLEAKLGRRDVVLVLGGGTLLDVVCYAAAQVRGGLSVVRMPTTMASILDGALSTTAAVNAGGVKDAYRVRCAPAAVVIDFNFATTVMDGVWRGGLGEMIRFAAACDAALMKKIAVSAPKLFARDRDLALELTRATVEKRLAKGPTDFALWSAMRLEAMSGYKLPHGYAVPIGICIDCAYAVERGYQKPEDQALICGALIECGSLDGLNHSQHLLTQVDNILVGLDVLLLSTGSSAVTLPGALGKTVVDETPDRELYRKAAGDFIKLASRSGSAKTEEPAAEAPAAAESGQPAEAGEER